ncbi:MAG: tetratricopeptide repeat protein, partial [Planctomycetaceae bacterium]|nr:tetratricopeptide repeat protein [Planctomycetaceae bacterium]
RVKILDFGLARVTTQPSGQSQTAHYDPVATDAGTVLGTVGYMSPEQVRGRSAEAASDLFSLGCVLYEMVTGQRAFRRDTAVETMNAILHEEPAELSVSGRQMPVELARLIRQCLVKNPIQRLHSARDLSLGLRTTATDPGLHWHALTRQRPRLIVGIGAALVLIGAVCGSAYFLTRDGKPSDPGKPAEETKAIDALAVLPFVYTEGDPTTEMLSETLAGHISDSLRQVGRRDLKIRPPSSVSRYARQRPDTLTIGRELNVPLIVTGTLRTQGNVMTITAEVVDAREDNLLWRKPYTCQRGETLDLDVQDQIVQDVAANLGLRLSDEEQRRLTRRRTADRDAYNLYRETMYHLGKFTPEGVAAGIKSGKQAIDKDPKYALAYSAVARCYILRGTLYEGPKKTFPDARTYVAEALKLDPNLPDAHAALAVIYLFHDWNWTATERELQQALALDPGVPLTWNFQGFSLAVQNRLPEALVAIRRGQELDPLSPARRHELAMCYNWMGDSDRAIVEAEKVLELDPNFPFSYRELGLAYLQKRMPEKAIEVLKAAVDRGQRHPRNMAMLGCAYAAAGRRGEAQGVLEQLKGLSPGRFAFAFSIAQIHAALGEPDAAFEWLQKALDERDSSVVWLKVDPTMVSLRSDPRFAQVLNDMGLPP